MLRDRFGIEIKEGQMVLLDLSKAPSNMVDGVVTYSGSTSITAAKGEPPMNRVTIFLQVDIAMPIMQPNFHGLVVVPAPPGYPLLKALGIQQGVEGNPGGLTQ